MSLTAIKRNVWEHSPIGSPQEEQKDNFFNTILGAGSGIVSGLSACNKESY